MVDGHIVTGRGRVIHAGKNSRGNEQYELDCGCVVTFIKLKTPHVWTIESDFSNCKDHVCSVECE